MSDGILEVDQNGSNKSGSRSRVDQIIQAPVPNIKEPVISVSVPVPVPVPKIKLTMGIENLL